MNSIVNRLIAGRPVAARPVFRARRRFPVYWTAEVANRTLPQTFASASEVFDFVAQRLASQR